jgi:peptidyl-prolyl cis-trans isomerase SurA
MDEYGSTSLNAKNIAQMVQRMSEAKVLEQRALGVADRHREFSALMQEYQDGILLYRVEQDEVWKKLVVNDSLLHIYYVENKERYRWPDRVSFAEIFVTSDSLAKIVYQEVRSGKDFGDVAQQYTVRRSFKEKKGVWALVPDSLNEITRYAATLAVDSISPPFKHPGGWSVIKLLVKDSARIKTFDEARTELIGGFQEQASKVREQEWISTLKAKYSVELNKELLSTAFTRKRVAAQ